MHPSTRSIHTTPHALPTAVSSVPHAHAADLQHLLTTEAGSPIGATSGRLRPLEPLQLDLPTAPVISMHPATRSIHATPHALPTAVSSDPHAHVADLQHLLTSETGSPVGTASRRLRPLEPH